MVDSLLLSKLFDASRRVHKVLFIGDYHQLPSVAPGNVLKDFIESVIKKKYLQMAVCGIFLLSTTVEYFRIVLK